MAAVGCQKYSLPWPWVKRTKEVVGNQLIEVPRCILPLVDRMGTIRIGEHGKGLILLDQLVDQQLCRLVMAVIIAGTVDQQKFTLEHVRKCDW